MRRAGPARDDRLETLTIDADGHLVDESPRAPGADLHVGRELLNSVWEHGRALLSGTPPAASTSPRAPSGGPWLPAPVGDGTIAPRARGILPPTFTRLLDLHPRRLDMLPGWFATAAAPHETLFVCGLALGPPERVRDGVWRLRGRLRSRARVRSIPIELLLWAHLGAWTKLRLEPERSIHVSGGYFRRGHRALDRLTERLQAELAAELS